MTTALAHPTDAVDLATARRPTDGVPGARDGAAQTARNPTARNPTARNPTPRNRTDPTRTDARPDTRTGHRTAMTDILTSPDRPIVDADADADVDPADVALAPSAPDPPSRDAAAPPPRPPTTRPANRIVDDETADTGQDDDSLAARSPVARCADGNGTLTALFFSDDVVDIARAKAMCGLCPLRPSCLAGALEREEPWGVWGGELLSGGRIVANKRPCGRPPKVPRPEVVYDEMGPVGFDLTA